MMRKRQMAKAADGDSDAEKEKEAAERRQADLKREYEAILAALDNFDEPERRDNARPVIISVCRPRHGREQIELLQTNFKVRSDFLRDAVLNDPDKDQQELQDEASQKFDPQEAEA
jgi:hypothetical protein